MPDERAPKRDDSRIIIHFVSHAALTCGPSSADLVNTGANLRHAQDYDCFYASVVEAENPALKFVPLAIQQKQIVVTCNYEARRRGLYKLQLISEAKRVCPDIVIVLGENLTRFRDASKMLYGFLRAQVWSDKAERLGFDEVSVGGLIGFRCSQRLVLGSHLAKHLRHRLEAESGYTATVGISTNKLLAKLVGNVNKPQNQTTLVPPYQPGVLEDSNVISFMDGHDIGKVPGIGFKLSQKIRAHLLGRQPAFQQGLVYGGTKEKVSVRDVRLSAGMGPNLLQEVLGGPGSEKGIGGRVWGLLNGVDGSEVGKAKSVPSQISIEDSYIRLDTIEEVRKQLLTLSRRLIERMHIDLTEEDEEVAEQLRRWLAHPRTLRLSTRPRPPLNADGTRSRTFKRISRSCPTPSFIFSLSENIDSLAEKLVTETIMPSFRKLHPEKSGWNLSLVNIAVANMVETASETVTGRGRDIGRMFRNQEEVLKDWQVTTDSTSSDEEGAETNEGCISPALEESSVAHISDEAEKPIEAGSEAGWESDEDERGSSQRCDTCNAVLPAFAMAAHKRFHLIPD
ncbi:MAG: hypothetical protein Q9160_006382 [Pyrenula sp. 1 TL-2023]